MMDDKFPTILSDKNEGSLLKSPLKTRLLEPFKFHGDIGQEIQIHEAIGHAEKLTTLWSCAPTMANMIALHSSFPKGYWRGCKVLELGSGVGLLGIAAAVLGAHVTLTELPDSEAGRLELLQLNVAANRVAIDRAGGSICIEGLDWKDDSLWKDIAKRGYDVVLGADLVYGNDDVWSALIGLLCELSAISPSNRNIKIPKIYSKTVDVNLKAVTCAEVATDAINKVEEHTIISTKFKRSLLAKHPGIYYPKSNGRDNEECVVGKHFHNVHRRRQSLDVDERILQNDKLNSNWLASKHTFEEAPSAAECKAQTNTEPLILFGFEHRPGRFPWSSPSCSLPGLENVAFFSRLAMCFNIDQFEPICPVEKFGFWPSNVSVFKLTWRWKNIHLSESSKGKRQNKLKQ